MNFAQIILPLNVRGTYTYTIPENLKIRIGMRVVVPFGGKKLYTGIVCEVHDRRPEAFKPKPIISSLDAEPILPKAQLQLWQWLADYYLCNIGEVYRFAVPSSLKLESETYIKRNDETKVDLADLNENEAHLLQALEVKNLINLQELEAFIPRKEIMKTLNHLIDKRIVVVDEKISEKYKIKETTYIRVAEGLLEKRPITAVLTDLGRSAKQKDLFLRIVSESSTKGVFLKKSELLKSHPGAATHLRSLVKKGLVEEYFKQEDRIAYYEGDLQQIDPLSEPQKRALNEIETAFTTKDTVLLYGVTGSGKTHIYTAAIEKCIEDGKNALMLFPEVSLTKQIIRRLEKKYELGFYHSKLTDFEKVEVWRKVRNNELKIILGTRSALFLPFQSLGLVVVDEEHDSQYKSTTVNPYFNARDVAMVLARQYGAKTILGSATPAVETYYWALKGKMGLVRLNERFEGTRLPEISFIDLKSAQQLKEVKGDFSFELIHEMKTQIEAKKQVLVLHNRRGYASVLECQSCGFVQYCSNCDVVMTYHKDTNELMCHYCGQRSAVPKICPKCHSENLTTKGLGIQQVEEELLKILPGVEVGRMDLDSMRRKYAYERFFDKMSRGEFDVVLGTQMISKGLDFDHVDLVTVPKGDSLLHNQDFRAEERAYQLLIQLSGRAGRKSNNGRMIIQSFEPDRPFFQKIANINDDIYQYFLKERERYLYPPFVHLILIEIKHRKEDKADRASKFMGAVLRKYLPEPCVLGPSPSPISRLRNLYQFQILLKLPRGKKYEFFKSFVRKAQEEFEEVGGYKSVKMTIQVDF